MGNFLSKGSTFIDGVTQLNASNLNAHVDEAVFKSTAISALSFKEPSGTEEVMINDAGTLKKTNITSIADLSTIVPVGTVVSFAGAAAPPGWFLCQGQALSRTTYSALTVIGTTAGRQIRLSFPPGLPRRVVAGVDAGASRTGTPILWEFPTGLGRRGFTITI
jgi:hypothetical protein